MGIALVDVKDNLYTLDEVYEKLKPTEGLVTYAFESDGSSKVEFDFPDEWAAGLKDQDGLFVTEATASIDGVERKLTKDAALELSSLYGITKEYALKSPGYLHAPQMNHWGSNTMKGKAVSLKMLATADTAMAFVQQSKVVFSPMSMLEAAVESVQAEWPNEPIYFDRKFHHDLKKTAIRMILPGTAFEMPSARAKKLDAVDEWFGGVHLATSLTGENPTLTEGFMFSWWCRNGATTSHTLSSRHKRKQGEDPVDVYAWVGTTADTIIEEINAELDAVASLTKVQLEGELTETLHNVYDHYAVPVAVRQAIQDNMTESDDLTAYGLMQAITQTANDESLGWKQIEDIMKVGGDISHAMSARCESCHKF